MPGGMAGPFRLGKVQTRNACFHQLCTRTVPVQIWGSDIKIKNDPVALINQNTIEADKPQYNKSDPIENSNRVASHKGSFKISLEKISDFPLIFPASTGLPAPQPHGR